jgi:hypothetical protein
MRQRSTVGVHLNIHITGVLLLGAKAEKGFHGGILIDRLLILGKNPCGVRFLTFHLKKKALPGKKPHPSIGNRTVIPTPVELVNLKLLAGRKLSLIRYS